jgi:hypothetical protein
MSSRAGGLYGGIQFSTTSAISPSQPQNLSPQPTQTQPPLELTEPSPLSQVEPPIEQQPVADAPSQKHTDAGAGGVSGKATAGIFFISCRVADIDLVLLKPIFPSNPKGGPLLSLLRPFVDPLFQKRSPLHLDYLSVLQ